MEQLMGICKSPWCKGTFFYTEDEMTEIDGVKVPPHTCRKCRSFDTQLSGGVEWKDREYEGSRLDGMAHPIKYKVTNYR
jgi:hypothetical protein